jgi:hypothetical protein
MKRRAISVMVLCMATISVLAYGLQQPNPDRLQQPNPDGYAPFASEASATNHSRDAQKQRGQPRALGASTSRPVKPQ